MGSILKKLERQIADLSKKSNDAVELGKKKWSGVQLKQQKQAKLLQLGEVVYDAFLKNTPGQAPVVELCREIQEIDDEINRIQQETNTGNTCGACGQATEEGTNFCPNCGTAIHDDDAGLKEKNEREECVNEHNSAG